jgi:hypothetical protein
MTSLLHLREKMSHAPSQTGELESSRFHGIRMDITKDIAGIPRKGLKTMCDFKENECATVDYLRYYRQRIYFIEFSDIEKSLKQIIDDVEVLNNLKQDRKIDKKTFKRFEKDVWDRQLIEIKNKVNGSERIFERLSCHLVSKHKSSYADKQNKKRHVIIVYRNSNKGEGDKDAIVFDYLKNQLSGTFPRIRVISTDELSLVFKS